MMFHLIICRGCGLNSGNTNSELSYIGKEEGPQSQTNLALVTWALPPSARWDLGNDHEWPVNMDK